MRLFYHAGYKNFGDVMNPWFWDQILPGLAKAGGDDVVFSGIGSILNDRLPAGRVNVVFGSGAGYGEPPQQRNWKFYAVRGPGTAKALGLSDVAFGDPAILLPRVVPAVAGGERQTLFVPHRESGALGGWEKPCNALGIRYVDPQSDFLQVIRTISGAGLVITESLHGAIIADAYRVPWIPIVLFHSSPFKWNDWANALGTHYSPRFVDQKTVKAFRTLALRATWKIQRDLAKRATRRDSIAAVARQADALVVAALRVGYLNRSAVFERRVEDLRRVLSECAPNLSPAGRVEELQDGLLKQVARFKSDWQL